MSVQINVKDAVKKYGQNIIIHDLNLHIKEGELFTLLGPSGCGKTTLLRMIAGFNSIEGGEFYFNDKLINNMEPSKRNIGMVFQNYAIFPHLSVKDNVAFGLKNRKCTPKVIEEETTKFLKLMKIEEFKDRLPERLSGGQQQRVALARALVIKPDVLLMDEPLSNLDAKLRVEMRSAIKDIQKQVGITTVYVTHDQEEAMAISDRIAVMKDGFIQHVGTPTNIYQRPSNLFVATFIGRSNILHNTLEIRDGKAYLKLNDGFELSIDNIDLNKAKEGECIVSIRPEEFVISPKDSDHGINGKIISSVFLGLNTHYNVVLSTNEEVEIIQESSIDGILANGSDVKLGIKKEKINIFTADGSSNMLVGVNNEEQ